MSAVAAWRSEPTIAPLTLTLVRGNHDRHAGEPPEEWGMGVVAGPWEMIGASDGTRGGTSAGDVRCAVVGLHEPALVRGALAIAGHIHPMVTLGGRERSACFAIRGGLVIVPAYGTFTGGVSIATLPMDLAPTRVLAVGPGRVIEVPRGLWSR
jgi:metallophosphoesterase superfamily enzyme